MRTKLVKESLYEKPEDEELFIDDEKEIKDKFFDLDQEIYDREASEDDEEVI